MKVLEAEPVRGKVPAELLDLGHATWRDPILFASWLFAHQLPPSDARGWFFTFSAGRDRWAIANGYTKPAGHARQVWIDHTRLAAEGVPWCGSLTRAMARAEYVSKDPEAFRAATELAPYGPVDDLYPNPKGRRAFDDYRRRHQQIGAPT